MGWRDLPDAMETQDHQERAVDAERRGTRARWAVAEQRDGAGWAAPAASASTATRKGLGLRRRALESRERCSARELCSTTRRDPPDLRDFPV